MKADKAKILAKERVFSKKKERKKLWFNDFKLAVTFYAENGFFESNLPRPSFDVEEDLIRILNRLGYSVETNERYLRVLWN